MPALKHYQDSHEEGVRARAREVYRHLLSDTSWAGLDDEPGQWGISPFAWSEAEDEHDVLARANYLTVLDEVEVHDVREITIKNWVGGIPIHFLAYRTDDYEVHQIIARNWAEYEDYPVLDDEKHSELEAERWIETLDRYLQFEVDEIHEYVPGRAADLAVFLAAEHEVYGADDLYLGDLDDLARPWLIREGIIPADPERGEEAPSSVDEAARLFDAGPGAEVHQDPLDLVTRERQGWTGPLPTRSA